MSNYVITTARAQERCAISLEGNCAIITEISKVTVQSREAWMYDSASNLPFAKKVKRFIDARLQAVSSRNMYSEQGLDPRIAPSSGQVCHAFTESWNWMPGSAQAQAAWPT